MNPFAPEKKRFPGWVSDWRIVCALVLISVLLLYYIYPSSPPTILTDFDDELDIYVAVGTAHTLFVAGRVAKSCYLREYDIYTGEELQTVYMYQESWPSGMETVKLGDVDCVAITFHQGQVEFRDQKDLKDIVLSGSVDGGNPSLMGKASPTQLLYLHDGLLDWLDCSVDPPQKVTDRKSVQLGTILDLTYHDYGYWLWRHQLYIHTSPGGGAIRCSDATTGVEKWAFSEALKGMEKPLKAGRLAVTGQPDYLVVTDYNNGCLQTFRWSKGGVSYTGAVKNFLNPIMVRWSDELGKLIVVYEDEGKVMISVAKWSFVKFGL